MPVDRIEAWLRMRDAKRFQKDALESAAAVDEIGDQAAQADRKIGRLNRSSKQSGSAFESLGASVNNVSGRLKLFGALAVVAGPGLISMASSAAGAAAGVGLLGATAGGAAAVGIGGLAAVTTQALGGLEKIRSAQDAYKLALQEHGRYSDEAVKAQEKLNAVIAVNGGNAVREYIKNLDHLKNAFKRDTAPARRDILGTLNSGLQAGNRLLPTFTRETNANAAALRSDLVPALQQLSGREVAGGIASLGKTFRGALGPGIRGSADFIIGILRYMRAAGPYVVQAARGFRGIGASFRDMSGDTGRVNEQVRTLVGHVRAWWGLGKAIGRLFVTIFNDSAESGRGLVVQLTDGVNKFNEWIKSKDGKKFFQDWSGLLSKVAHNVVQVVVGLAPLVDALLPALQSASGGVGLGLSLIFWRMKVIADILKILGPLAGPIVFLFMAWRTATLLLSAAQTALNFVLGLSPLGLIVLGIAAVVAAVYLMYTKWAWFHHAIDAIWGAIKTAASATKDWIVNAWNNVVNFFSRLPGRISRAVSGMWNGIKTGFKDAINYVIRAWNNLSFGMSAKKVAGHTVIPGFHVGTPDIPLLASGGVIPPGGMGIVGDAGPELARSGTGGTEVMPLARSAAASSLGGAIHVHSRVVVQVDRKTIGEATAEEAADWGARKGRES